jgi:ABC-type polysaccharide/polyol phosphate export permease
LPEAAVTTQQAAATEAHPAPHRPGFWEDARTVIRDFWEYRELLYQLTLRDIRLRYKQAVMGFGWAVFMPLFIVAAGLIIRFAMAYFSGGSVERDMAGALVVKSTPWAFFIGALGFASGALIGNQNLVTKVYFPREILPLATTLAQGFDFAIGSIAVVIALPFLGADLSFALLWVPLLLVMLLLFTGGVCLFVACANLFFRDVKYIVQVLLTFGIFITPVLIEPSMLGQTGASVIMLNPMSPILEGFRLAVMEGHNLLTPLVERTGDGSPVVAWSPWYLAYGAAVSLTAWLASSVMFHRLEFKFAEYV